MSLFTSLVACNRELRTSPTLYLQISAKYNGRSVVKLSDGQACASRLTSRGSQSCGCVCMSCEICCTDNTDDMKRMYCCPLNLISWMHAVLIYCSLPNPLAAPESDLVVVVDAWLSAPGTVLAPARPTTLRHLDSLMLQMRNDIVFQILQTVPVFCSPPL